MVPSSRRHHFNQALEVSSRGQIAKKITHAVLGYEEPGNVSGPSSVIQDVRLEWDEQSVSLQKTSAVWILLDA